MFLALSYSCLCANYGSQVLRCEWRCSFFLSLRCCWSIARRRSRIKEVKDQFIPKRQYHGCWQRKNPYHWKPGTIRFQYQKVNTDITMAINWLRRCVTRWAKIWSLQWRHNGHDGVSNHQPYDCLLNRLFRRRSNKTSKPCVTGLCEGNSEVTGEFPA